MSTEPVFPPSPCMYPGVVRLWPAGLTDAVVAAKLQELHPRPGRVPWTPGQVATWRRGQASPPERCRPDLAGVLGLTFLELAGAFTVTE